MNRKGQDSWQLFKWFPRIFMLLIIVLFCYYLFISFWIVDYDMKTARSATVHPKILHSLTLTGIEEQCTQKDKTSTQITRCAIGRPNIIRLEKFTTSNLEELFYYEHETRPDTIVRLVTAPLSAKVTLEYNSPEEGKQERVIHINEEDYDFYTEQVQLQQDRYGVTYSTTSVTILKEDYSMHNGLLHIEVIVP